MRPDGIEILMSALRRSLWIVALLILLGVVAMNLMRARQGPEYQATASVLLSPTDLAASVAGVDTFVDPDRRDAAEIDLASARELYVEASAESDATTSELASAVAVSLDGSSLQFTATDMTEEGALDKANAVAQTYPEWRADVAGAAIDRAIGEVREQIGETGGNPELTEQLNRLDLAKTLTSGNVLLVEAARGAVKTRPSPIRDSILGGLLGLFFGLLSVALREAIDTRVRSETEVEEILDAPVLGTVETLPRRAQLVAFGRRNERYADMYALLAANVAQIIKSGERTVIAVTSATAAEGKTTTASNLAAALARRNARVLLVDMDTRRPSLARIFRIPATTPGVDAVIARKAKLDDALWTVSLNGRRSGAPGALSTAEPADERREGDGRPGSLQVLPLATGRSGSGLAYSERLPTFFKELQRRADYVIVDTPPALATAEMTELSRLVDIVLVVVRHGRVSRRSLASLTRLYRSWPGVRVNAVLVDTPRGEGYSYYGGS
jgi:Mrp family chromosome partitioning ATPase